MADGEIVVSGFTKTDIKNAISKLNSAAGMSTLYFPDGIYVGSGFSIPSHTKVVFSKRAVILPDVSNTEIFMLRGNFPADYTSLTADSFMGDVAISVASTAGLQAGDWIYIRSKAVLAGINTFGNLTAEIRRIEKIVGKTITINQSLQYDFKVADRSDVGKIGAFVENVEIHGLRIGQYGFKTKFWRGIAMNFCMNVRIFDACFIGSRDVGGADMEGAGAVVIRNSVDVVVDRLRANEIGWYGVSLTGACQHIKIKDGLFEKCRHATSVVWQDTDADYGEPHEILISDCVSTNSTLSGFDAHDTGRGITYVNCAAFDSGDNGFQIRNDGPTRLINCTAIRSQNDGVKISSLIGEDEDKVKQIRTVIIDGGQYSDNRRYGINSTADMCRITNADFEGNANSAIIAVGTVVANCTFNRNGGNNGAITYGHSSALPVTDFTITASRFYYDAQRQPYIVQARAVYDERERLRHLRMTHNLFSGYAAVALVYSITTGSVPHPAMDDNHFDTDYASHRGLTILKSGAATVNSSYVYVSNNGTYRATNPKIKLTVTAPGGTGGALYIERVAAGSFTIRSTSNTDASTVLWEIGY